MLEDLGPFSRAISEAEQARYFRMLCDILATQEGSITFAKNAESPGISLCLKTDRATIRYIASLDPLFMANSLSAMLADFDRHCGS